MSGDADEVERRAPNVLSGALVNCLVSCSQLEDVEPAGEPSPVYEILNCLRLSSPEVEAPAWPAGEGG